MTNYRHTRVKTARFFRAYALADGKRHDPGAIAWDQILKRAEDATASERTSKSGVRFEIHRVTGSEARLLGIHKPLDPAFMTREDPNSGGAIVDMMSTEAASPGEDQAQQLFASSAVYFYPAHNVFALCQGPNSAARQSAVVDFMDAFASLGEGVHWKCEPLLDEGQVEEFKNAGGVVKAEAVFDSTRQLLDQDLGLGPAAGGMATLPEEIASTIGGDVKVTLKIELQSEADSKTVRSKFHNYVVKALPALLRRDSKAKVTAVDSSGTREVLELAAHKIAASFSIDSTESEVMQFSQLIRRLHEVAIDNRGTVEKIITGRE